MSVTQNGGDARTDSELLEAVRQGDRDAFGELYIRHQSRAYRFACTLLGSAQGADDLVAEAFVKVLKRLVVGGGPTTAFCSYLLTTVRTTLYKQLASDRLVDRQVELSTLPVPVPERDPVVDQLDMDLAARALDSLSDRWQLVLRYLEIEDKSTAAVAELLGIRSNAVAALAFRAREALRVAYLQMHVNTEVEGSCRETADNLAAWLCGRLNRRVRSRIRWHLDSCEACTNAAAELLDLAAQLRRMVPLAACQPVLVRENQRIETASRTVVYAGCEA